MTIVVVEDDSRVADFLVRGLRAEGHSVTLARTGPDGFELIAATPPDVVILDLLLPGRSGLEVCQELRVARVNVPILMLTALGTTDDVITGLHMGADDYMTKPFSFAELLARLDALHRRATQAEPRPAGLVVGDLHFDRETLEVRCGDRLIDLTSKELAFLELLMSRPGKVFSRAHILNSVWGVSADPLTNVVDVYVSRLRSKLGIREGPGTITTMRGSGYKIEPR